MSLIKSKGAIPSPFSLAKFSRTEALSPHARTTVDVDGSTISFYTGILRAPVQLPEEKRDYFFLHAKEAEEELERILDGSPLQYTLEDVRGDFAEKGIAVFISHGGYFAAAVFKGDRAVLHKSFRRYINRKGQGHRQSKHANKNASRKCRSAGGRLRAFNEDKNNREIRELLQEWRSTLEACSSVWLACPGDNKKIFVEELPSTCVVRTVPMTVGRATFSNCQRIAAEISRVVTGNGSVASDVDDDDDYMGSRDEEEDDDDDDDEDDDNNEEEEEEHLSSE